MVDAQPQADTEEPSSSRTQEVSNPRRDRRPSFLATAACAILLFEIARGGLEVGIYRNIIVGPHLLEPCRWSRMEQA